MLGLRVVGGAAGARDDALACGGEREPGPVDAERR